MPLDLNNMDYDWPEVFAVAGAEGGVTIDPRQDIEKVIASVDGENEGKDWQAIIKLKDGRYAWITAWCDYTGWGCQDGGTIHFATTLKKLLNPFITPIWLDEDMRRELTKIKIKIPDNIPLDKWEVRELSKKVK